MSQAAEGSLLRPPNEAGGVARACAEPWCRACPAGLGAGRPLLCRPAAVSQTWLLRGPKGRSVCRAQRVLLAQAAGRINARCGAAEWRL